MCVFTPILFMVLIFCGGIIYPIWMIIHCLTSSLNGLNKALWIIVMLFAGPLGAVLYGLIRCEKKSVPWIAAIVVICIGVLSIFPLISMIRSAGSLVIADFSKIAGVNTQELSSKELAQFKTSLDTLQEEAKSTDLELMHKALSFAELFGIMTQDNKINSLEYKEWMDKFESRKLLDYDAFSEYVRSRRNQ